jgi:hypothetical protein
LDSKTTTFQFERRHKARLLPRSFLYVLSNLNIETYQALKKGNNEGSMGSKSKYQIMKSSENIQKGSETKNQKKENTPDTISKSISKVLENSKNNNN